MSAESDREWEAVAKKHEGATHVPGLTPTQVVARYDEWAAADYDKSFRTIYNGPRYAAEAAAGMVPEEARATLRVLDVAAGTGLVGQHLHRLGFRLLDAVDPSQGMLGRLKETKLYSNTFQEFVGLGQPTKVPVDLYDIVVMSGGFGEGHIPVEGVDDMIRAAKPGGLVVLVMRREYLDTVDQYRGRLLPFMARRETEGRWTKVSEKVVPQYSMGTKDGVIYIYRVL